MLKETINRSTNMNKKKQNPKTQRSGGNLKDNTVFCNCLRIMGLYLIYTLFIYYLLFIGIMRN